MQKYDALVPLIYLIVVRYVHFYDEDVRYYRIYKEIAINVKNGSVPYEKAIINHYLYPNCMSACSVTPRI